jgi:hypothetical protein
VTLNFPTQNDWASIVRSTGSPETSGKRNQLGFDVIEWTSIVLIQGSALHIQNLMQMINLFTQP